MKKAFLFLFGGILMILVSGELIGRYYGLTSFPVFISDPDFEYILAPNQNRFIYRKHFITNKYSQRSEPISENDTIVGLLIGDSVIFGGNSIDQDDIATSILETSLTSRMKRRVRVLNISSKSWGPDNGAAYIKKFGLFGSKKIILVVSSHDAHDSMTFKRIVGVQPSHPDRNSISAWPKILDKGLPIVFGKLVKKSSEIDTSGLSQSAQFNPGFDYFNNLSKESKASLVVYLHKTTNEIKKQRLESGGEEIRSYCKMNNIKLIEANEQLNMYSDYIHFNERGHKFLAHILKPEFEATFSK
jgi:hypothetical protein